MSTWRDVEEAALQCPTLQAAVTMARSGVPQLEALAGAAVALSKQNKRLIDAEVQRVASREAFWQDIGRPADAHLGAVGGE